MFGDNTISKSQRIEYGLEKILTTHIMLLCFFIGVYYFNFKQTSIDELEAEGLVEDIDDKTNPVVKFYHLNQRNILAAIIFIPLTAYLVIKAINLRK